jgi:hypothetical protein
VNFGGTTSAEVEWFCTKFSDAKTFREILVLRLDRYSFTVFIAANRVEIGGVFT